LPSLKGGTVLSTFETPRRIKYRVECLKLLFSAGALPKLRFYHIPASPALLLLFFVVFINFFFNNTHAHSAQVTLEWEPLEEAYVAGYSLYYGNSSRNYDVSVALGNWTSVTVADLENGRSYYFAVTSYDDDGQESDFSNEVSWPSSVDDSGAGGGCFVATAAYSSRMDSAVEVLCQFRDRCSLCNKVGWGLPVFAVALAFKTLSFIVQFRRRIYIGHRA